MKNITKNENGTYAVRVLTKKGVLEYNYDGSDANMESEAVAKVIIDSTKAEGIKYLEEVKQVGGGKLDFKQFRSISHIASDIKKEWKKPHFGAEPYIQAMLELDTIDNMYHYDTAKDILIRFLCNAMHFRGGNAKALKQELKDILETTK
jgi:hypothetical protein